MWDAETESFRPTAYERERAEFAQMQRDLQARKRARWRLWLGVMIAGRPRRPRRPRRPGQRTARAPLRGVPGRS